MPEVADGAQYEIRRGFAQSTKGCISDVLCQVFKQFNISLAAFAPTDSLEDLYCPLRLRATGDTLITDLIPTEIHKGADHVHHAGILIDYGHAARAHDRANLSESIIVDGNIEVLRRDASAGRSS